MDLTKPNPFLEANNKLINLSQDIYIHSGRADSAREDYLLKKAAYENEYSRFLLESKVKDSDATQSDLKALATNLSYAARLEFIKADSAYHALQNTLKAKRDEVEVLREVSYNLRKEAGFG